ncbi:unnamed protein product, partial [marine sediment metagenome]
NHNKEGTVKATKAVDRKGFIKKSLAGAAGIAFAGSARASLYHPEPSLQQPERKIVYRTLGKTGLKLPVISMGVMNTDNPALIGAALDNGINHLDTAHGYGNEEVIGGTLKGRPRDSFIIATKVHGIKMDTPRETEKAFLDEFHLSLRRLGLDYVEILYLHGVGIVTNRANTLYEPFLNVLQKIKKSGKARFVGVSAHRNQPEIIQAAIDSKVYDVVLAAYNFTYGNRGKVKQAIAKAAQAGLGIVAMKTLAGGYLDWAFLRGTYERER